MCLLDIGGLASGGWVLTNPLQGRVSLPHDALLNDPAQAMDLNASDCTSSGPSLVSPVTGRGGAEELAT